MEASTYERRLIAPKDSVYYENNTCNQNCEMCVSPVAAVRLNDSVTLPQNLDSFWTLPNAADAVTALHVDRNQSNDWHPVLVCVSQAFPQIRAAYPKFGIRIPQSNCTLTTATCLLDDLKLAPSSRKLRIIANDEMLN